MDCSVGKPGLVKFRFSGYQKFIIALLAFLQFTIIVDFMIISPLGAIIIPTLHITPGQFGWAISSYAFSAAIAGILAAGFADRFDRKRLLLFFYCGFILGTGCCAFAPNYQLLLFARIVTGLFGGVISAVVLAIATDLFPLEMRGRVMGFVQTAFAGAQVMGLPAGIYFANRWGWHFPFLAIVAAALPASLVILLYMKPVVAHLALKQEDSPWRHLAGTVFEPKYALGFLTMAVVTAGGFILMPFGAAFIVNNIGIPGTNLPMIYLVSGLCTIILAPLIGKASDRFGKFQTFSFGTVITLIMVAVWTNLGRQSLIFLMIINLIWYVGVFSCIIPSQALISAIPEITKRGSFNAVSASLQQFSGGLACGLAGMIVIEGPTGQLQHFNQVGYIVMTMALIALVLMYFVHATIPERLAR